MQNLLFFYWTSVVLMLTLEGMLVNMLKMLGTWKLTVWHHGCLWSSTTLNWYTGSSWPLSQHCQSHC